MDIIPDSQLKTQRTLSAQHNFSELDTVLNDKVIQFRCSVHSDEYCESIDLSLSASNPRVCMLCYQDFNILPQKTLSVRQLLKCSPESFLNTFPILENMSLIREVKAIVGTTDAMVNQFQEFFKFLKASIEVDIEKIKNLQKLKFDRVSDQYLKTLQTFQSISKIDEFKEALLANANDPASSQLQQFIQTHINSSKMNTVLIEKELQEFNKLRNSFSLETAKQIQGQIRASLGEIDFFQDLDSLKHKINKEVETRVLQDTIQQLKGTITNLEQQLTEEKRLKEEYCYEKIKFQKLLEESKSSTQGQELNFGQNVKKQQKHTDLPNTDATSLSQGASEHLKQQSLLSQIRCLSQTDFFNSDSKMTIDVKDNGQITITSKDPNEWVGCYLRDPLVKENKYVVRIQLNNNTDEEPNLCFGLLEGMFKATAYLATYDMFYNENDGSENVVPIRGGKLVSQSGSKKIGEKMLEFRIDLSQKQLRISDLPKYSKVSEMKYSKNIRDQEDYHVGFQIWGINNSITLLDVLTVKEFDGKMGENEII